MQFRKFEGNPILSPNEKNPWEELVVCNPGAWYENGTFYLLYRAAGSDDAHIIRLGLAESNDGYNFKRVSDTPVFAPSADGPDSGGVEDPRIVKFGNDFYVTYAYRPYPPGQYWNFDHDEVLTPLLSDEHPLVLRKNITNTGLAITKDFRSWKRLGRITKTNLDDRDVILFPERINGIHENKFAKLHRPKEWIGSEFGTKYPAIWITFSDDVMEWEEPSSLLLCGIEGTWEEKIGGNTPPLKTSDGWLVLYHGVEKGGQGHYKVGAVLLDLKDPSVVIARSPEPLMEPTEWYELEGPYQGCVFPVGNVVVNGTLFIYYGGADKYCAVATCSLEELLKYLLKFLVKKQ